MRPSSASAGGAQLGARADPEARPTVHEPIAPIDRLPKWVLCTPLVVQWLWLGLWYRSLTLPSALNPAIETGGLVGESKLSYLLLIDRSFASFVARTAVVQSGCDPELVRRQLGIPFPLIAKPDIGWCGYGVRRIADVKELRAYAGAYPPSEQFLIQRLISGAHEAGILYTRHPGAANGQIVAMTLRHAPHVVGDGVQPLSVLISQSELAFRKSGIGAQNVLGSEASRVPDAGEWVSLQTVASARVGGRYEDVSAVVTHALDRRVDDISRSMGEFHYGRYDVMFETVELLLNGDFTIIEVNGAGSEAIQFWDPRLSLAQALRGVFRKQRELFALADEMRLRGFRPVSLFALASAYIRQWRLIKRYMPSN